MLTLVLNSFNPARIEPTSGVWNETRKPLVAHWRTVSGADLFTVNLHLSSKGGSSSTQGDARPPVNSPVENRTKQVGSVAVGLPFVLIDNKWLKRTPFLSLGLHQSRP